MVHGLRRSLARPCLNQGRLELVPNSISNSISPSRRSEMQMRVRAKFGIRFRIKPSEINFAARLPDQLALGTARFARRPVHLTAGASASRRCSLTRHGPPAHPRGLIRIPPPAARQGRRSATHRRGPDDTPPLQGGMRFKVAGYRGLAPPATVRRPSGTWVGSELCWCRIRRIVNC
jgi:hypothetical protein